MPKPAKSFLFGFLIAFALACLATFTLYARQQKPAQAGADASCKCTSGGITEGMAVIHCTCGINSCVAVRSTAAPGSVAVSCK